MTPATAPADRMPDLDEAGQFKFTPARVAEAERAVAEGRVGVDRYGRREWRDTAAHGLRIVVTGRGGMYQFAGRIDGRPVRKTLGPCRTLTLAEARKLAGELKYNSTAAAKLAPRRKAAAPGEPLQAVWERYIADAEAGRFVARRRLRPATIRSYRGVWGAQLKPHADRPLDWIADNIETIFEPIRAEAPYQANRTLALLRIVFVYAIRKGVWKGSNPVAEAQARGLTRHAEQPRQRVFTDAERRRFLKACDAAPSPWGHLFTFAIETGLRRRALLGLRWSHADIDGGRLVIPQSLLKSAGGGELGIDLTPAAVAVLKAVAGDEEHEADRPIFSWADGRPLTPSPYERAFHDIADKAGLKGLRPHDVRRDVGARLVAAGTPLPIVARILGHSPKSVAMLARTYAPVSDATAKAWMLKATTGKRSTPMVRPVAKRANAKPAASQRPSRAPAAGK
jgi:integrase